MSENANDKNNNEVAPEKNDNEVNGVVLEFTAQTEVTKGDLKTSKLLHGESDEEQKISCSNQETLQPHSNVSHLNIERKATSSSSSVMSNEAILEAQIKLIAIYASEAKVLEIEMNKLIKVLYSKHPEAKPYLLKMKKLLQDHADIQRSLDQAKKAS